MDDYTVLVVHTFEMGTEKDAALKPLEEAAEVYSAWQFVDQAHERQDGVMEGCWKNTLAEEIADCIQACCNLAARHCVDLKQAMHEVELKNWKRGRYESPQPEMTEGAKEILDRLVAKAEDAS